MENQNELLNIIENRINEINKILSNITFVDTNVMLKNKTIIEQNEQNIALKQFSFLNSFDINELAKILPTSFSNELTNLSFYISILSTSYAGELSKQPQAIEQIKNILSNIHKYVKEIIEKQEVAKKEALVYENEKK